MVHALKVLHTQLPSLGIRGGFFFDFANHAVLRRFPGLHKAGDAGQGLVRPCGPAKFDPGTHPPLLKQQGIVPMCAVASRAAQALLAASGLVEPRQRLRAVRTKLERLHAKCSLGENAGR